MNRAGCGGASRAARIPQALRHTHLGLTRRHAVRASAPFALPCTSAAARTGG